MNQLDHIECRDTSGHDKTSGSSFRDQQALADAVRDQRRAFDVSDMAEEVDDLIVDLAKNGMADLIGPYLIDKMNTTIQRRAERQERA